MILPEMVTGQTMRHLVPISERHAMHPEAAAAFSALQKAARRAGFNLQPVSVFRDFSSQQTIWNNKFSGKRAVLDAQSQPLDIALLDEGQLCQAIMHWSAMPGASRHHWGTDIDIYDPQLLPAGSSLQLIPQEYEDGGYFSALTEWLSQHIARYHFYRPYVRYRGGVAGEPWHLSYYPVAQSFAALLDADMLQRAWQEQEIAGKLWLLRHLPQLLVDYVHNVEESL
ncbi:MAG: M15 family metallopeptidase [Enterobacteriaceae bacterium]